VRNSDSTARQSDESAATKTGSCYLVDRPSHALAVNVTVPEDNIGRQLAAFVNDLGSRQVAAVDQDLRTGCHKTINSRSGSVQLVMSV